MKEWAKPGFTIVELLIVVVVIAILAAITMVSYNGVQQSARESKMKSDIATIIKAIHAARSVESKTLTEVTGSTATGVGCWAQPSNTDLAALPKTDACWVRYYKTLENLGAAANANISGLVDPWGRPYLIDENEGEGGACGRDTVAVYRQPFISGFGVMSGFSSYNVPHSGYSGC